MGNNEITKRVERGDHLHDLLVLQAMIEAGIGNGVVANLYREEMGESYEKIKNGDLASVADVCSLVAKMYESSTAFQKYRFLLIALDFAMRNDLSESDDADALRDAGDPLWYALDKSEINTLNQLSEDLYKEWKPKEFFDREPSGWLKGAKRPNQK